MMTKKTRGFTLAELIVVIAIFAIMAALLAPFVRMTKNRSDEINCANNLRQISLGLHMYAAGNDGNFPPTIGALYPKYVKNESTFDCPASKLTGTQDVPDYTYITGLTELSDPSEVIVYDLGGNHNSRGRNILRINGLVEWARKGDRKPR